MKKLGKRKSETLATVEAYNACTSSCTFPNCSCGLSGNFANTSNNQHYASVVAVYSVASGK